AGSDTPLADFNIAGTVIVGILLYMVIITVISSIAESRRKAVDRLMTALVATAFLIALLPLISLLWTVVATRRTVRRRVLAGSDTPLADFNIAGTVIVGILLYMVIITVISS
ncbi:phosphate ABC transporter, permease protein PstA, partial [Methylobacterium radiotolerans]